MTHWGVIVGCTFCFVNLPLRVLSVLMLRTLFIHRATWTVLKFHLHPFFSPLWKHLERSPKAVIFSLLSTRTALTALPTMLNMKKHQRSHLTAQMYLLICFCWPKTLRVVVICEEVVATRSASLRRNPWGLRHQQTAFTQVMLIPREFMDIYSCWYCPWLLPDNDEPFHSIHSGDTYCYMVMVFNAKLELVGKKICIRLRLKSFQKLLLFLSHFQE